MNNQYNSFRSLRIEINEYDPYLLSNAAEQAELELEQRLEWFDPKRGSYIGTCFYKDYETFKYDLRQTLADELSELEKELAELELIESFVTPLMP